MLFFVENPCFVNHGCLNGADCDNAGTCICKEGFSGATCDTSKFNINEYLFDVMSSDDFVNYLNKGIHCMMIFKHFHFS